MNKPEYLEALEQVQESIAKSKAPIKGSLQDMALKAAKHCILICLHDVRDEPGLTRVHLQKLDNLVTKIFYQPYDEDEDESYD